MLRDYQTECVNKIRDKLYREKSRSVVLQLPTGSGKTAIVSEITKAISGNKKRTWFVVPRRELVRQSSEHFAKWRIPHGIIDAGHKESRAFLTHIVSLQTLTRRLEKTKDWPDVLFVDEAHLNYDSQKRIFSKLPSETKIIGVTATPGRMDNRGLDTLYNDIAYGASIPYLTARGYLSPLRYYAPPTDGIEK